MCQDLKDCYDLNISPLNRRIILLDIPSNSTLVHSSQSPWANRTYLELQCPKDERLRQRDDHSTTSHNKALPQLALCICFDIYTQKLYARRTMMYVKTSLLSSDLENILKLHNIEEFKIRKKLLRRACASLDTNVEFALLVRKCIN